MVALRWLRVLLCACLVGASSGVWAETLYGVVIGIADGDTVTVLSMQQRQYKIRLAQIDAPERKMPFGNRSRQHLADLVFKRSVRIEVEGIDKYGRTVGTIWLGKVDVNLEQVRSGLAWAYPAYLRDRNYLLVQQGARAARRGLWVHKDPVPPWEWRHRKRR